MQLELQSQQMTPMVVWVCKHETTNPKGDVHVLQVEDSKQQRGIGWKRARHAGHEAAIKSGNSAASVDLAGCVPEARVLALARNVRVALRALDHINRIVWCPVEQPAAG